MDEILISVGLSLIALTGGMFLLAKINKDSLGMIYTIVAYFIIIASFINLACTGLLCVGKMYGKMYGKAQHHELMMYKKHKKGYKDYHHGMNKYHQSGPMNCCAMNDCKPGSGHMMMHSEKDGKMMMRDSLYNKKGVEK